MNLINISLKNQAFVRLTYCVLNTKSNVNCENLLNESNLYRVELIFTVNLYRVKENVIWKTLSISELVLDLSQSSTEMNLVFHLEYVNFVDK